MKKTILLLIFLFSLFVAKSQDTIVKKSGDLIIAKVLEIGTTEIKYKRFDFQEGPTYIEIKSNLDRIIYSNGTKEEFPSKETKINKPETISYNDYYNPNAGPVNPQSKMEPYGSRYKYQGRKIGEREMQRILMSTKDKQIIGLVQSAKDANKMQYIGFAAIPLGIGSLVALANSFNTSPSGSYTGTNSGLVSVSVILAAAAIACPVVSIVSKSKRKKCNREAVKLYNEKY